MTKKVIIRWSVRMPSSSEYYSPAMACASPPEIKYNTT